MDGRFLFNADVVNASRNFVCIRVATYEDAEEAKYLKQVFRSRSGELENTVFGMFDPSGRQVVRSGRSPGFAFRDAADMVRSMNAIAKRFSANSPHKDEKNLPEFAKPHVAINVAACDHLPVILVYGPKQERAAAEARLAKLLWQDTFAGQFVVSTTDRAKDLKDIRDFDGKPGIVVIEPGPFGLSGTRMQQLALDIEADDLDSKLKKALADFPRKDVDYQSHIRFGQQLGLDWKTQIPVTDRQSLQAKERSRARTGSRRN